MLKEGGQLLADVNGGYLPEGLVAARREEIDWVHSEGVYESSQCENARIQA